MSSTPPTSTTHDDIDTSHVLKPRTNGTKSKKHPTTKTKNKTKNKTKGNKKKGKKKSNDTELTNIETRVIKDPSTKNKKTIKTPNKSPRHLTPTDRKPQKRLSGLDIMQKFQVPSDISLSSIELIYSKLSNTKFPHKKRIEMIQTCTNILSSTSCDAATIKYAIDNFKKIFITQLKDKKFAIHSELYKYLKIFIHKHYKKYKIKNSKILSVLMNHIGRIKDKKQILAVDEMINIMIDGIGLKDKKQLILMLNEFIRCGTSSKNKTIKQKAWRFLYIALDGKYNKNKEKNLDTKILDCVTKGIKQSLSNNDKVIQEGSFKILDFLYGINERQRVNKLFNKMSVTAKRRYNEYYPFSTPGKYISPKRNSLKQKSKGKLDHNKRVSVGQYNLDKNMLTGKFFKRRDSLERLKKGKIQKKRDKKKKKNKGKGKEKKVNVKEVQNKVLSDITNSKGSKTKLKSLSTKASKKKGKKNKGKSKGKNKTKGKNKGTKGVKKSKNTETKSDNNNVTKNVTKNVSEDEDEDEPKLSKHSHGRSNKNLFEGNLNIGGFDFNDLDDETLLDSPLPNESHEEEDIDININNINNKKDSQYINFPISFLMNEESKLNWKMLEYLCSDNGMKTHEFLGVLSRINNDIKIYENKIENINYNQCIIDSLPLHSEDEIEINATQLSYNLMRLLWTENGESGTEAVSTFILRKCAEITLHALAVYNRKISLGNVFHGRVLLESLLSVCPEVFMNVLTSTYNDEIIYENIQLLFKNAVFRNLHQGNLNSLVLDLICYKPLDPDQYLQILPYKRELISLFKQWEFMKYLLDISANNSQNDDLVSTKYCTFFIDLVARSAGIGEAAPLFENNAYLIIDSFMNGLLDKEGKRTTWHRNFCGQILIQFIDICSRETILDPAALIAAQNGLGLPEESPNILYSLFKQCLERLHYYIPQLCDLVINYESQYNEIKLNYTMIKKPFGQVRLNCLELLAMSVDFAQFECGNVLGMIPMKFWDNLLEMALIHKNNNIFLCHFRRLIHLAMIFRRRILKRLIVEKGLLNRFIKFYETETARTALHGYVLQMIYDIWQHDNN